MFISDKVVLFRKPLQLYSLATDKVIADFKNLDEAFAFTVGNKTLAQIISGKDYNDAVDKWLRANQKKYGYSYTYVKAK